MNINHKHRIYTLCVSLISLGIGGYFILSAFNENINLFVTPGQAIIQANNNHKRLLRVGGLVEKGSVAWSDDRMKVFFRLTDGENNLEVEYTGVLPSLFREGQGLVVSGKLTGKKVLMANTILAKHDENYRPPNRKGL
ncbi:MAG TPA: cytochrome c maturation protein CcmE [Gammaproteobacteria bacterium]|nr:cytochrome c maturation protein CcmE [Gammaproteobacteria bacterium]